MNTRTDIFYVILFTAFSFNSVFPQEQSIQEAKSKLNDLLLEKYELKAQILQDKFQNNRLFKEISLEQRQQHRIRLLDRYKEIGYDPLLSHFYYNRSVHPNRIAQLENIGALGKINISTLYKQRVVGAEVIVIGRVRKIAYDSDPSSLFHSSNIILVDEWLRDDFGLAEDYEELIVKFYRGPSGDHWINSSIEPQVIIGEKLLLFLSRANYVHHVLFFHKKPDKEEFVPNALRLMSTGEKYVITDNRIKIDYVEHDLNTIKSEIKDIVKILDVPNFFNK